MAIIKIQDISMYYEIHGQGEPIVFIAGFGADHSTWAGLIDTFTNKHQIILLDNRGIGQTEVPDGPYSIEQMADDAAGLCSALLIEKAHFVGNSMGGFILQTLAFKYPYLVKSAIISNASWFLQSPFHVYLEAQLELLKLGTPLETLTKASCSWIFSYQFLNQPGVLDYLIKMGVENPNPFTLQGYEGQLAALHAFDASAWVSQIRVPTLVLAGGEDLIMHHTAVQSLAEKIPNADYYCFKNCGHLPFIEYPEEFSKRVLEYIAGITKLL